MEQINIQVPNDAAQSDLEWLVREKKLEAWAIFEVIDGGKLTEFLVYDPFNSSLPFRRASDEERLLSILHEVWAKKKFWWQKAA